MSIRYLILGILEEHPHHGYEIHRTIRETFGDLVPVSFGQLYPTLHKMLDEGLIDRKTEPGLKSLEKNVYLITDRGQSVLSEWLEDGPKHSKLRLKDDFTLMFFFMKNLGKEKMLRLLEGQRLFLLEEIRSYERKLAAIDRNREYFLHAVMRKGSAHLRAELAWLEEVIRDTENRSYVP